VRLAIVLTSVALLATACLRSGDALVVGAVYPVTGPQGSGGSQEYHGALLAADYANEHGGVAGTPIAIDLQASPSAEGVPTAVRTLAKKTSVVIGSYGSTLSVQAARIAAQHNVVFWETGAVGDMPGKLPRSDRFFRVAPTGEELGAAAVDFVQQHVLHATDVKYGVAYVDDVYGQAVGGGAIAEIERHGATPVRYNYDPRFRDFDALARRIAADEVNVVVVAAYIDDGVALRRALVRNHVGLLANIGTSSSYCMPEFGRRLGKDAVGVFASDKPDGDILRTTSLKPDAVKALGWARKRYRTRYGGDMPAPALAGFAGAWALFHDVLPKAHGRTAASIAAAARATSLPPGSLPNGSGLLFGRDGDNTRALTVIWEWVAPGKRAVVWPPAFATAKLSS
jgi:branched-chain amino acid transport system substrate-binding protein